MSFAGTVNAPRAVLIVLYRIEIFRIPGCCTCLFIVLIVLYRDEKMKYYEKTIFDKILYHLL